jgi:hypothetical protein
MKECICAQSPKAMLSLPFCTQAVCCSLLKIMLGARLMAVLLCDIHVLHSALLNSLTLLTRGGNSWSLCSSTSSIVQASAITFVGTLSAQFPFLCTITALLQEGLPAWN